MAMNQRSAPPQPLVARRPVAHRRLALLDIARALKRANAAGSAQRPLRGKNLALLSDKTPDGKSSNFQRAATELGAQVAHVRPGESGIEGASRAARLLGRLYDAIDCEGLDAATLSRSTAKPACPVFNGLADDAHPTRVLATLLDLQDRSGPPLAGLRVAYLGDASTPRGDALLQAAALTGMELRIGAPRDAWPDAQRLEHATRVAQTTGARLLLLESATDAADGADFVLDERNGTQAATADDQTICDAGRVAEHARLIVPGRPLSSGGQMILEKRSRRRSACK